MRSPSPAPLSYLLNFYFAAGKGIVVGATGVVGAVGAVGANGVVVVDAPVGDVSGVDVSGVDAGAAVSMTSSR
jgi:hypothetical protein